MHPRPLPTRSWARGSPAGRGRPTVRVSTGRRRGLSSTAPFPPERSALLLRLAIEARHGSDDLDERRDEVVALVGPERGEKALIDARGGWLCRGQRALALRRQAHGV